MFSIAQIPLDLSCRTTCRTTCLRLVGDQVADKSETLSPTFFSTKKVGDQVSDFFCRKLVTDLSATRSPFFICRKLAARSISTCRDRSILSETRSPTFFLLKTCRRPGFKQVLSKIDIMEFGHK